LIDGPPKSIFERKTSLFYLFAVRWRWGIKTKQKIPVQVHLRNAEWKTEGRSHCELTSVSHNNEWLIQTDASEKKPFYLRW
jgi:hypothetical protein